MAGGGAPTPTKGGKRSVDFVVNLVPTIDLLSVLISFLLITAVWTQLARINVGNVIPKGSHKPQQQNQEKQNPLMIWLEPTSVRAYIGVEQAGTAQAIGTDKEMFTALRDTLERLKEAGGAGPDTKVILCVGEEVPYSRIVDVMDICLDVGLSALQVVDVKPTCDKS